MELCQLDCRLILASLADGPRRWGHRVDQYRQRRTHSDLRRRLGSFRSRADARGHLGGQVHETGKVFLSLHDPRRNERHHRRAL